MIYLEELLEDGTTIIVAEIEKRTIILTKNIFFGIIDILYCKGDNQMFNNEQDFEEWKVDCLNKAKEILTMDTEKENNRSKKIETTAN